MAIESQPIPITSLAHSATTGQGADDHHGEAHTLASHADSQATQAEIEAGTDVNKYIPPDLLIHSPGVAKVWGGVSSSGALLSPDHGVSSVTDTGVGDRLINHSVNFSTAVTFPIGGIDANAAHQITGFEARAADTTQMTCRDADGLVDRAQFFVIFGDQ